ncbi:MAG: amidase family protein [Gemmatimonadota bacterium]
MSDIVFASAIEQAAAIRARRISAVELLDAHLAQLDARNPELNAVVITDVERARDQARNADAMRASGHVCGPLHGVPFTLKDCHATSGMRTTCGFPPLAGYVPSSDGTVAARLKEAGGILFGKTNVAMLLGDYQTNNPLFGRTNNPWHLGRTAGGSSGGAAAAVAAGMTPFEMGTDLAGSLRVPAHYCGVYGLKPTEHRVSLDGIVAGPPDAPRPIRLMSCIGPIARSVDDLALLYGIIAGPDGRDTDVPPVPVTTHPPMDLEPLRIAIAPSLSTFPVSDAIRAVIVELARLLAPQCAAVDEVALPSIDGAALFEPAQLALGAFQPGQTAPSLAAYLQALHVRDGHIIAWDAFFDDWDVLICPPAMVTAFPHCEQGASIDVDGKDESYWMAHAAATWFNYTGHPSAVIPVSLDGDGLPIGVQLVAKRWEDARLLAIVRAISQVTGGFSRPPGY